MLSPNAAAQQHPNQVSTHNGTLSSLSLLNDTLGQFSSCLTCFFSTALLLIVGVLQVWCCLLKILVLVMLLQLHEFQVLSKCLWLPNLDPSYLSTKASAHCPSNCGSVGWRFMPYTQSLGSPFPIREHTLLIGLIPGWATYGRQPINVSLSLSLSNQ